MKRRGKGRGFISPDPGTQHYKGPLAPINDDTLCVTLFDNYSVDVDASGNLNTFITNDPSAARNWTEMSTSWITYRVLGILVRYTPKGVVNTTTLGGFDGYQSIVHSPTISAPASMAQAASTGLARVWTAFKPFTRVWRMESSQEATFQLCSSPSATSKAVLLYAAAGGVSLHYGNIEIQYLVQFKTHAL